MAEIFETVMLVCFGFSWPVNAYKSYRAGTAKNTSIAFILLIMAGYVAGIAAKIIGHRFNYVLAVYILNLVTVSANLVIYFINRKRDRSMESSGKA